MADKKAAPLFSLDPAVLAGIDAIQKSPVFKAVTNLQRQLAPMPDMSNLLGNLPDLGRPYPAFNLEGYSRFAALYLPVDELLAVPADDSPLDEYVDAVAAVLAKHGQLSPWQVAMLILRAGGLSTDEAFSRYMAGVSEGRQQGIDESKRARSDASRKAVKQRGDQVQKAAFLSWAKTALESGATPSNIDEIQSLDGFQAEWSQRNLEVLKRWCRDAGFTLKAGRPRKKT